MEKNCASCLYFHNCSVDGPDPYGYCSTNPEVAGYCSLWEGERFEICPCEEWIKKN